VPPAELLERRHRPALAGLAGRLVEQAEPYYRSALAGLPALPLRSAWAIAAARTVYRDIGRKVQRRGAAAWDSRTGTGPVRKATVLVTSLGRALDAHSLARLRTPPSRAGLWTRPRHED
jgi:phytoene synthase